MTGGRLNVAVVGAGVAGLTVATELQGRGALITIFEAAETLGAESCSRYAGGMLAPYCELESADEAVVKLGEEAAEWWNKNTGLVHQMGSLVLTLGRDRNELRRFGDRTREFDTVSAEEIARLEPDLSGRFSRGLFFAGEAHLDPRLALSSLGRKLESDGARLKLGAHANPEDLTSDYDVVFDCRGFAGRESLGDLRGVKGEMLIIRTGDISLGRPVRLIHPRYPIYIVPRADGQFMLGATMIESGERSRVTARSMLELLSAAYALHPSFGEAEIIEMGCDVRPAYADNLPRVSQSGKVISINGLYRHGFLLSPAMARQAADIVLPGEVALAHSA